MKKQIIDNNPLITTNEVLRPTHVEIDLRQLKDNYFAIKKHVSPSKIMVILKANAYGHGLVRIAKFMESLKADYLGVAVLEEGILLREQGIKMPILVLGGILGNQIPLFIKNNLTLTASSIEKLQAINSAAEAMNTIAKVHLKIDTGMERIGVHYYNSENFLKNTLRYKNIKFEGIYSHFANSGSADLSYTNLQYERFLESLDFFDKNSIETPIRHISNSGAIFQFPQANLDFVRPGISLFGVMPSMNVKNIIGVKPTLTWKSRVVYFKVIKPNHPVGYGSTWKTKHNIRAVTVPVGYGDGYMRSMSDKAKVLLNDKIYNVIGTISMDQIVVNIENDSSYNNDEIILIGEGQTNTITCENLASWAGTIPYEILTNINTRVPRIYKKQ